QRGLLPGRRKHSPAHGLPRVHHIHQSKTNTVRRPKSIPLPGLGRGLGSRDQEPDRLNNAPAPSPVLGLNAPSGGCRRGETSETYIPRTSTRRSSGVRRPQNAVSVKPSLLREATPTGSSANGR